MTHRTIAFIGGGNMARSLVGGLLKNGWSRDNLLVSDPDPDARHALVQALGIKTTENNVEAVKLADIVVLAIKPQILPEVAKELADTMNKKKPLVISIAAGIRTSSLGKWLGEGVPLVRAMPNTAALIGSGATGLYADKHVDAELRDTAETILRAAGIVVWVDDEDLIDVVTALSGSGPAYFFLVMEALETAAIKQGLSADTARLLTLETAFGAAKMALEDSKGLANLRQRVTSPGVRRKKQSSHLKTTISAPCLRTRSTRRRAGLANWPSCWEKNNERTGNRITTRPDTNGIRYFYIYGYAAHDSADGACRFL